MLKTLIQMFKNLEGCSFLCTVYYGGYGKRGIVGILKVLIAPGVIKQSFIEVFVVCMIR